MTKGKQRSGIKRHLLRRSRPARYWLMIRALDILRIILPILPHGLIIRTGRIIGSLACLICTRARKRAISQYLAAGLAANQVDAARSVRQVFCSLGAGGFEWLHSKGWNNDQFRTHVEWSGQENVRQALERGNGVILITAHLGNWELLLRTYLVEMGGGVGVVAADMKHQGLNEWLRKIRHEEGCRWISVREGLIGIMRHLRRGGAIAMLADQDSRRAKGIFVKFFGRPAHTLSAPARLAWKTGAALVPLSILRDEHDPRQHRVHVAPPIYPRQGAAEEEETIRLTQAYTQAIEQHILRAPTQWAWIHARWRYKPGDKIKVRTTG
jgi:KDO2-lipid IV(A) lauroyltransferase